ncbi:MAG: MGMT family protein [Marinilabilia sp.]
MEDKQGFFSRVYEVVQTVPYGRVTTYGAVAKAVGAPGSARLVGWAMNKAFSHSSFVPAHRVVNRHGYLTGKHAFPGEKTMREMLENEGIRVENDRVINFRKIVWFPPVVENK